MSYRSFGTVRQLPSGSWQARYRDPETRDLVAAPHTFASKLDATRWLSTVETDTSRGRWVDPSAGNVALARYAEDWVENHPGLRPRTRENYRSNLRLHILPTLGMTELGRLTPTMVRRWHAQLVKQGALSKSTVAKCYRLVHAIMETAVADEMIARNPCVVHGASADRSAERPVASLAEVLALTEAAGTRYRAMVLTASLTGLRLGELLALRRRHVDLRKATITVTEQLYELSDGTQQLGPPKSDAGHRVVSVPPQIVEALTEHIDAFADPGPDGFVFTSPNGGPLRRGNFRQRVWLPAVQATGLEHLRFHDLRHTGNTLAAATGASTKELMARLGHSSSGAALRYQHATRERDEAIARALGELLEQAAPLASAAS